MVQRLPFLVTLWDDLPLAQIFELDLALTVIAGIGAYLLLFQISRLTLRRIRAELPLVILNCSRGPLLILILLLGIRVSLSQLPTSESVVWSIRIANAVGVLAVTYWIAQLFTQVVIFFLRRYARRTEAVWDDVLVPILERLVPVLTYILGIFFFLQSLDIDITGIWVAFGGATFVLGFALKDILGNFFSGLVLLIDTPFQFGDVISLSDEAEDGAIAVIKNIGLRVTHLYMIDSDCDVYMPNAVLGNKTIVNLTRPTPHFAANIEVKVPAKVDQTKAAALITKAVLAHPDTLGEISEKLQCLSEYQGPPYPVPAGSLSRQVAGQIRLESEQIVNHHLRGVEQDLEKLTRKIDRVETGGLDPHEIESIKIDLEGILSRVGLQVIDEGKAFWRGTQLQEAGDPDPDSSLIGAIRHWYHTWQKDPNLSAEDQGILQDEWETKLEQLRVKLSKLYGKIINPGGDETRLDDYARDVNDWIHNNFKESTILWKGPKVRLKSIYSSTMEFTVKFYVDHIKLERWDRGYRVMDEVRTEIMRQLQDAGVYTI